MDMLDFKEFLRDSFKTILIIAVLIILVVYVFSLQQVVGHSMEPTLADGDILVLNKLGYHIFGVEKNDIVAVQYDDGYLVKRIIGVEGDTISAKNNIVYVNGKAIEEPYLKGNITEDFNVSSRVPKNKYFVLGDNRENSKDSREIGFIDKKDIVGKSMFRIWPILKFKIV